MDWVPLLDVTEEYMRDLVHDCEPGSPLHRVTQRVIGSLGSGPDGIISAFQSTVETEDEDEDPNLMAGFSSAV